MGKDNFRPPPLVTPKPLNVFLWHLNYSTTLGVRLHTQIFAMWQGGWYRRTIKHLSLVTLMNTQKYKRNQSNYVCTHASSTLHMSLTILKASSMWMMMDGTCAFINCRTSRDLGVGSSCKCMVDDDTVKISRMCVPCVSFSRSDDSTESTIPLFKNHAGSSVHTFYGR